MILDLGLPDIDGIELIRRIRAISKVPIVVLSSRGDERAKVEALELGADDYLTKPFGMEELVARLRTALRHGFQEKGEDPVFRNGDLTVDLVRRRVVVAGNEVKLSPTEFAMLQLLVQHAGKVLTHQQILREVWGNAEDVQYLRVYVRQLRRKLEADPEQPRHIVTESGVGYRLQLVDQLPQDGRTRFWWTNEPARCYDRLRAPGAVRRPGFSEKSLGRGHGDRGNHDAAERRRQFAGGQQGAGAEGTRPARRGGDPPR